MNDICKNYSTKINKNINSLIFLYEGNKVNFELSFKEQANNIDRNNNQMKILVSECDEKNESVCCLKNVNLLEKIEIVYFSRILFSHLEEKIKLKLIKYNKKLQNKMDMKLMNYKFNTGRYIIYENNIKGKEFNGYNKNLVFEGEYLNGERNGKGKEYDYFRKLKFEGEYYDGKLKFEGEYLNEEKLVGKLYDKNGNLYCDLKNANGLIKEFDCYGNLEFEGEYFNGKRNGKGKEYYDDDNLKFEGEYLNGKRNGKGKEYDYNSILEFEGEYLNGKRWSGIGYDIMNNKVYELKNGEGIVQKYYENGKLEFEAEFLKGERNGKGKEYYYDGKLQFEGEYLNDKRNGKGKEYDYDGKLIFEGEYLYSYKLSGKYYIDGELEYEGDYLYDKKWNGYMIKNGMEKDMIEMGI